MEQIPTPKQPEDLDKEAAELFREEDEKTVEDLQEALHIDKLLKLMVGYLGRGFLTDDMPLMWALEKLEKRKFELSGINPEEAEDGDEEEKGP